MAHVVPPDPLGTVFTHEVLARLRVVCKLKPAEPLADRISILTAHGPIPLEEPAATRMRYWRARKVAWDAHVAAAFACGLLSGKHGADAVSRLTSVDDENFRSGMSECMAAWFVSGKLKLPVTPRPDGAAGRVPDLSVADAEGDITIEAVHGAAPQRVLRICGR